jgi:hypothetical protein
MLASERSRIKRQNDTICDLKDKINSVNDSVDNVTIGTANTWAIFMPDGSPTDMSPDWTHSLDIEPRVGILYGCSP